MTKQEHGRRYYIHYRLKHKFNLKINAPERTTALTQEQFDQLPWKAQFYLKELAGTFKYNIQINLL